MKSMLRSKKVWIGLVMVALGAGALWWQRTPILTWYYLRQLAQANEQEVAAWAERVADLDTAAVPGLLEHLRAGPIAGANAETALLLLVERWPADDGRALALADALRGGFAGYREAGKQAAMQVVIALLRKSASPPPAAFTLAAGDMVRAMSDGADPAATADPDARRRLLVLTGLLVQRGNPGQWVELGRRLALEGLADAAAEHKIAAIHVALHLAPQGEKELLAKVVPLLRAADVRVRRAAVVAVASAPDVIGEDDLLFLLHDADAEVQRLCEVALRSRGLQDTHITLARLISDDNAAARLGVLEHLRRATDLEPGVWLRRLSQDPAPAVRAAAVRAAGDQRRIDLSDRLRQMAADDPSPTVRQLAEHYLRRPRVREE